MNTPQINDACILAVPVRECGEALRSLHGIAGLRVSQRADRPHSGLSPVLREQVCERLQCASTRLPADLGLEIVAAYRSAALQRQLLDNRLRRVRAQSPGLSTEEVQVRATEFVSDPALYSPHTTGGAVDVALVDRRGQRLDLGSLKHEPRAWTECEDLTPEQRRNRRLLIDAMAGAGFANYPREWWHWSYGDRYWAYTTGAQHAIYDHIAYQPRISLATRAARHIKRSLRALLSQH